MFSVDQHSDHPGVALDLATTCGGDAAMTEEARIGTPRSGVGNCAKTLAWGDEGPAFCAQHAWYWTSFMPPTTVRCPMPFNIVFAKVRTRVRIDSIVEVPGFTGRTGSRRKSLLIIIAASRSESPRNNSSRSQQL